MLPSTSPSTRPSASAPTFSPRARALLLFALIVVAAISRLVPHPPNFSPIEAIALFGGAYFLNRSWAVLAPLAAMFLSDLLLGIMQGGIYFEYFASAHFLAIYACIALSAVLGFGLRGRVKSVRVLGYSLAGSLLFFLITNFAVWLTATDVVAHPACTAGLAACYVAGLPFLKWTVLGTLFYAALLFGGYELLQRRVPGLRAPALAN
ncbi:MAG: DUF6580 family putative transport protein [Lysobacterales bacterium]